MEVARASAMVGFVATSNVEAARRFGLTASGTMAHSYIEAFPTEREAFEAFASDLPDARRSSSTPTTRWAASARDRA